MVLVNNKAMFKMSVNCEELNRLHDFIGYLNLKREREATDELSNIFAYPPDVKERIIFLRLLPGTLNATKTQMNIINISATYCSYSFI